MVAGENVQIKDVASLVQPAPSAKPGQLPVGFGTNCAAG
jgi:hypothetical protein